MALVRRSSTSGTTSNMGWLNIRSRDLKLAMDDRFFNPAVFHDANGKPRTAAEIIQWCEAEAVGLGMRGVIKPSSSLKFSKFGTTFYRSILLPSDYADRPLWRNAVLWAHEIQHARQWRGYGRGRFAMNYVLRARYRWAVEMQCYRTSVRAYLHLGHSPTNYIERRAKGFMKSYSAGSLRASSVIRHTRSVLEDATTYAP